MPRRNLDIQVAYIKQFVPGKLIEAWHNHMDVCMVADMKQQHFATQKIIDKLTAEVKKEIKQSLAVSNPYNIKQYGSILEIVQYEEQRAALRMRGERLVPV